MDLNGFEWSKATKMTMVKVHCRHQWLCCRPVKTASLKNKFEKIPLYDVVVVKR